MEPISRNPDRFEQKIGDETMKWSAKCGGRDRPGSWNRTHHVDEHIVGGPGRFQANIAQCNNVSENKVSDEETGNDQMSWSEALAETARRN